MKSDCLPDSAFYAQYSFQLRKFGRKVRSPHLNRSKFLNSSRKIKNKSDFYSGFCWNPLKPFQSLKMGQKTPPKKTIARCGPSKDRSHNARGWPRTIKLQQPCTEAPDYDVPSKAPYGYGRWLKIIQWLQTYHQKSSQYRTLLTERASPPCCLDSLDVYPSHKSWVYGKFVWDDAPSPSCLDFVTQGPGLCN